MRTQRIRNKVLLIFLFFQGLPQSVLFSQDSVLITPEIYANRRKAVLEQMPDSSVAIFQSATIKNRSNDINYEYRQESNLLYLTGLISPKTVLILVKDGIEIDETVAEEILFVPNGDPHGASVEDAAIPIEEAKNKLGFKIVKPFDKFKDEVNHILEGKKLLFYSFHKSYLHQPLLEHRCLIGPEGKRALKEKFSGLKIKSPKKILTDLRQIKSPQELQLMQKAIDLTCNALIEALRRVRPGMYEYQLEAIIEYIFKFGGSEFPAFPSIIGSGPNSTIIHYSKNRRKMERGDLVVMDIGAEYHGYAADVTRTIPVSGKFSEEQREIYEIVLHAQNEAIAAVKPGVPFRKLHKIVKQVIEEAGYGKYFIHSTSHYVGLDVHDVGDYGSLKPGMVITVEPGIYIKEGADLDPAYWNIGVRIEDDILVTKNGYKNLSKKAPREIEEIEKLMKEDREPTFGID